MSGCWIERTHDAHLALPSHVLESARSVTSLRQLSLGCFVACVRCRANISFFFIRTDSRGSGTVLSADRCVNTQTCGRAKIHTRTLREKYVWQTIIYVLCQRFSKISRLRKHFGYKKIPESHTKPNKQQMICENVKSTCLLCRTVSRGQWEEGRNV